MGKTDYFIPARIDKDLENKVITVARRDTKEKSTLPSDNTEALVDLLARVHDDMYAKADDELRSNITFITDLGQQTEAINHMLWCENEDCGHEIEERTDMSILGVPIDDPKKEGGCIVCGKPTSTSIYASKTY